MAQQEKRERDFYTDMWNPLIDCIVDQNIDDNTYRITLQKIVEDTKNEGFLIFPPSRCFPARVQKYSPDQLWFKYTEPELMVIAMIERSCYGTKATNAYISKTYMGVRYSRFGESSDVYESSCPLSILLTMEKVFSRWGSVSYKERRTCTWLSMLIGQEVQFIPREKN